MQLKTLRLINFKNYQDETVVFSKGFTAILGKNGAGKTNILEAIHYLSLTRGYSNSTDAQNNDSAYFNGTAPTSTVFSLGSNSTPNASGGTYVSYCFAEISGFSKFGSYTGNGSTDGTFVYLGFRPRYVMIKASSTTGNWFIFDSSRPGSPVEPRAPF